MKKLSFAISVLMIVLLLSSCSSKSSPESSINSVTENSTETVNRTAYKLEEYYEPSEFDNYGYEWINSIKNVDNELYITGGKTTGSGNRCFIVSDGSETPECFNLNFDYSSIRDACIVDNTMYVLHDDTVSFVDIQTGKLTGEVKIKDEVSNIQSDGSNFIFKMFAGDTLYIYDSEFRFIESKNIPELLNAPKNMEHYRFLRTEDRIYLAGDIEGIITLYVLDNDYKLIFKKDYSDLPGMAYQIYDDGNNIVLVSSDGFSSPETNEYVTNAYIDVLNRNDGSVEKIYESPNTQFVFWNYNGKEIISNLVDIISVCNLETNEKSEYVLPEDFVPERISQSSGNIIFFEGNESEIKNCITHVSASGEINKYETDSDMRNDGITGAGEYFYSLSNDESGLTTVIFKNSKFDTVKEITLENAEDSDKFGYINIECSADKIYSFWYDCDNIPWITVYDYEGKIIKSYTFSYPVIYKFLSDGNSVYAVYDKTYDGCGIAKITDTEAVPLSHFSGLEINNFYDGDSSYSLYYTIGSVVYGFNEKQNTSTRIMNYIDSGVSNIGEVFAKISDDTYVCEISSGDDISWIQLTKADEETVNRLNARKIIVAAGDTAYWGNAVADAIINFNRTSKDYYIVSQDYSETYESGIDKFQNDVIKGNIPDLFISGGSLDTRLLENLNCLENLDKYIKNSSIKFEDFYIRNSENNVINYISPVIGFGVIENSDCIEELQGNISTDEFLVTAEKNNLKFSDCTRYQLFDYLVADNIEDYIDYSDKDCSFKSDTFINLIEYIRDSESSAGELKLNIYNNIYDLMNFSGENIYFDISSDALCSSHINENIRMSIYNKSENKDAVWTFIESVFELNEELFECGIPVDRENTDINGVNYYDAAGIDRDALSKILSNGKIISSPDNNIRKILYQELDAFFEGSLSAEEYAENIQNQVKLYLSEI